jgi:hypothetical protein
MDIVFMINGNCTLVDVVIIDLICVDFVCKLFQGMTIMIIVQAKVVPYHNQHFENHFVLLIVEIFKCIYEQVNDFFHQCANIAWLAKGFKDPPLSILCSFYR